LVQGFSGAESFKCTNHASYQAEKSQAAWKQVPVRIIQ
jgi:hypothetical protein